MKTINFTELFYSSWNTFKPHVHSLVLPFFVIPLILSLGLSYLSEQLGFVGMLPGMDHPVLTIVGFFIDAFFAYWGFRTVSNILSGGVFDWNDIRKINGAHFAKYLGIYLLIIVLFFVLIAISLGIPALFSWYTVPLVGIPLMIIFGVSALLITFFVNMHAAIQSGSVFDLFKEGIHIGKSNIKNTLKFCFSTLKFLVFPIIGVWLLSSGRFFFSGYPELMYLGVGLLYVIIIYATLRIIPAYVAYYHIVVSEYNKSDKLTEVSQETQKEETIINDEDATQNKTVKEEEKPLR